MNLRRTLTPLALLVTLAPARHAALGTIWTVDDDGPADFASLTAAIASPLVASGDVLEVAPGTYAAFTLLAKDLTIVAAASGTAPQVNGQSTVDGPASFTLAGLKLERLALRNVAGRAQIDDCVFQAPDFDVAALSIENCAAALVSRSSVVSAFSPHCYYYPPIPAFAIQGSSVAIVDGLVSGGYASQTECDGQKAIVCTSSDLILAGVDVTGGGGGPSGLFVCCSGYGADGLTAAFSSVSVRGTSAVLTGGNSPGLSTPDGVDVVVDQSTLVYSGVKDQALLTIQNPGLASSIHTPAPPEPYLVIRGSDEPGDARRLLLYGPAGAPAIVASALAPAFFGLGGFEGEFWLDPTALFEVFVLTTQGQATPTAHQWTIPISPSLAGATLHVQSVFPTVPGTLDASALFVANSSSIVVRY